MRGTQLVQALRALVAMAVVVMMAGVSSGTLWPGAWGNLLGADSAIARAFPALEPSARYIGDVADNGPVCDPRPGPRVQTTRDPSGVLQILITAGTDLQGFPARLREIRVGPIQNAAVSGSPFTARTTPFVVPVPDSTQAVLQMTRLVADQPSQVTLVIADDCGDWQTFVGGGTGVAVAAPSATATPVPVVPGQPNGSIPIVMTVSGSSTQYPPGSRPRVQINSRPYAACNLSVTWPNGQVDASPAQPADGSGICRYRPTVPPGMASGMATATGTVQDYFGFNLQSSQFRVGGTIGAIPPGDNILGAEEGAREQDRDDDGGNADNLD